MKYADARLLRLRRWLQPHLVSMAICRASQQHHSTRGDARWRQPRCRNPPSLLRALCTPTEPARGAPQILRARFAAISSATPARRWADIKPPTPVRHQTEDHKHVNRRTGAAACSYGRLWVSVNPVFRAHRDGPGRRMAWAGLPRRTAQFDSSPMSRERGHRSRQFTQARRYWRDYIT